MYARLTTSIGLALLCLAAGCGVENAGDVGCVTGSSIETVCTVNGGGTATSSNDPAPVPLAFTSFDDGCVGSCKDGFSAFFETPTFNCLISANSLPLGTAALTSGNVFCNEASGQHSSLTFASGSVTIESVDDVSLRASFTVELTMPEGDTIRVSNGTLSIGGCHDAEVCTF
jgi:hypothetical protein